MNCKLVVRSLLG
jgi:hypothetical protein